MKGRVSLGSSDRLPEEPHCQTTKEFDAFHIEKIAIV
jgi:hypothetical protein